MLSIDLLKGQGIPIKSRPGGAALLAITIAIPVVTALVMLGNYVQNTIILSSQRQFIRNAETKIAGLSNALEIQQTSKIQFANINACMEDVGYILRQQIQWSPILRVLAESIPRTLTLEELNVKSLTVRLNIPKRDDPEQITYINVPKRILHINLYGRANSSSDEAVSNFLKKLNSSEIITSKTEIIRIISQTTERDKNLMHYVVECVFKHK